MVRSVRTLSDIRQQLLNGQLGIGDWGQHVVDMIFVAEQTVLPRHAAGMAAMAAILFYCTELGREIMRVVLTVAFQIGADAALGLPQQHHRYLYLYR